MTHIHNRVRSINFGTEVVLPFVMRFGYRKVQDIKNNKSLKKSQGTPSRPDKEDERLFLERVRREVALPEESLFIEFAEMVTQFGYVSAKRTASRDGLTFVRCLYLV